MALKVILDVDTGIDDAFALLFAARSPQVDLLAVTCVDGNAGVDQVARNSLHVLDTAQASHIPVAVGARSPLMGEALGAEEVHGSDGLGGLAPDRAGRPVDPRHAIELMRDITTGEEEGSVTLVALGPLTNVALFIATYPDTAHKLGRIVIMGGSTSGGNVTASAEFNIWHDPEAAQIVFSSGIPITMYGLDVFYGLPVEDTDLDFLREQGGKAATLASDLVQFLKNVPITDATLGDYGALASLVFPDWTEHEVMHVTIDTTQGPNRGRTVCDNRPEIPGIPFERVGHPCTIIMKTESRKMVDTWISTICETPESR
jgi:pyrimidine-specific ribonucleoside hydrolase